LNDDITLTAGARTDNRTRMLRALLSGPARSRAELGQALGLSRATVTLLLLELERAGMVAQQSDDRGSDRPRSIGRPPLQVSLAANAAFAVGLDFGHRHIRAAVCDLAGGLIADRWSAGEVDGHPNASFDLAQRLVGEVLAEARAPAHHVIGVGVGLAVPLDSRSHAIHAGRILPGWSGISPASELETRLGMPVRVENDANAGALGEQLFGAGRGMADLVYLRLSAGVGVGLILNGRPYRGASGVAGEIGHIPVVEDGLICRCGNRGCLETVASSVAVTELVSLSRGEPVSLPALLALVREGDRGACRAVADAGEAVGAAIAATVNLLNPELVIIGGELAGAGDVLLDPIRHAVRRQAVAPAADAVRVVPSALGDRAEVLGAAAIQLARAPEAMAARLARTAQP
jgi:predicted NBD/HSP70 family sugar kinase/biotin operon repressor